MALTPDTVRYEQGLKICEKIIPWGAVWNKNYGTYTKGSKYKADRKLSNGTGKVAAITIHNTDGGANAETYTRATYPNQNMKDCRVHYYVDDKEAWQNLQEYEVGWHAGDGRGNGNETTLSIEIIMRGKAIANDAKSEDNGALLAAILLHRHGLGIDKLKKHQDWSGKYCPAYIMPHWEEFKTKVQAYLNKLSAQQEKPEGGGYAGNTIYRVQVGAFAVKGNADACLAEAKAAGFSDAYITKSN
jgi:N-acetylmuramoyl-L-alanine amidase CwlA